MKKILVSLAAAVGVTGLIAFFRYQPSAPTAATSAPPTTPITTSPGSTTASTTAAYKDGQYTGSSVDVGYGLVQVKAIISGGRITDVQFLQMPGGDHETVQHTQMAQPVLLQETISAQSANVNAVSGATSTSEGYIQSLQTALTQAKA